MALQAWGLIVEASVAGVIISEWHQVAVQTATDASTISVTAHSARETIKTSIATIS